MVHASDARIGSVPADVSKNGAPGLANRVGTRYSPVTGASASIRRASATGLEGHIWAGQRFGRTFDQFLRSVAARRPLGAMRAGRGGRRGPPQEVPSMARRPRAHAVALVIIVLAAVAAVGLTARPASAATDPAANTVLAFGGAPQLGPNPGRMLNAAFTNIAATPSGRGYWVVAS